MADDPLGEEMMMFKGHSLTVGAALATAGSALLGFAPAAQANHHGMHHHHMQHMRRAATKPKLIPAHLKPGYVGAPGYVAGPPGPAVPMLIDFGTGGILGLK